MSMIGFETAAEDLGVPLASLKRAVANAGAATGIDATTLNVKAVPGYAASGTFFLKLVNGVLTFVEDAG